jgi:hypothetical protein
MQYVYRNSEPGLWTVGFYDPDGKWHPETDHTSTQAAAERVRELNGGDSARDPHQEELSLLDKLALGALTGLLGCAALFERRTTSYGFDDATMPPPKDAARMAYDYAAAMLLERLVRDRFGNVSQVAD